MERMFKLRDILADGLMMAGITIVLIGGAVLAYKASKPKELAESADGYYEIYTAYDYVRFWQKVTHNMPFLNGRLMGDIYLNDKEDYGNWEEADFIWKSWEVPFFSGDFDGNGYTVYGIYSENGYGMAELNAGLIHDISIKNALIMGEKDLGGICLYNEGTISGCEFGGALKSTASESDVYSWMAGISMENDGIIERCGYKGTMMECVPSKHRSKAGISVWNSGEINNCYNFTWENYEKGNDMYYSFANHGEKNCFLTEDVRWKTYAYGKFFSLDEMDALYLRAFLDKDLYTMYLGMQSPPVCFEQAVRMREELKKRIRINDGLEEDKSLFDSFKMEEEIFLKKGGENEIGQKMLEEIGIDEKQSALRKALLDKKVCDLLWRVLVYEGVNWKNLILEGAGRKEAGKAAGGFGEGGIGQGKESLFEIWIYDKYYKDQQVKLAGYQIEPGLEKDWELAWDFCTDILMEENVRSWEHETWKMLEGEDGKEGEGLFILYRTREGAYGFFYVVEGMLYRAEMQGDFSETDGQENAIQKNDIRINDTQKNDTSKMIRPQMPQKEIIRQICICAQICRFWQEWGTDMEEKSIMEKNLDILSVKKWIKDLPTKEWKEDDEEIEITEKTQFFNRIWGIMAETVWEGKIVG